MEFIKAHKWLLLGGVAVVAVLYLYGGSSGGNSSASNDYLTEVQAATALQSAQLEANSQAQQTVAAVQANQDTINGQIALAQIQQQMNANNNEVAGNVALANINAQQQVAELVSTLEAQTQQNAQNQATAQTAINVNGQVQQSQTLANALVAVSTNQANVSIAGINAAANVATSCHGLGCLF